MKNDCGCSGNTLIFACCFRRILMESITVGILSALWLGILTSISPCPLASNIAAISFIGKQAGSVKKSLLTGMLYSIGRAVTYLVLGVLITYGMFSVPGLSNFLQNYMNKLLGPLLIIIGVFLLEMIEVNLTGFGVSSQSADKIDKGSLWGAFLIGIIFALSFCPISAALFFLSLIPLALKFNSPVLLPFLYGAGTALPVLIFGFILCFSAQYVGKVYNRLTALEFWAKKVTGGVFIAVGIYYCIHYIIFFLDNCIVHKRPVMREISLLSFEG